MRVTLLQRPGRVKIDDFNTSLRQALSTLERGLSAKAKIAGFSKGGWAQVEVNGEDSEILEELISRELCRATTSLSEVELFGNYSGIVASEHRNHLEIDLGIESPKPLTAGIDLSALRAQLSDGKTQTIEEITENYCVNSESKISIRVTRIGADSGTIEGWMADSQIDLFAEWISTNLERVQVYGCTRPQLDSSIRRTGLERDIVSIETMTLTTHSVICKLGTDSIGLIPKLGSILRTTELKPFIPNRIISRCRKW